MKSNPDPDPDTDIFFLKVCLSKIGEIFYPGILFDYEALQELNQPLGTSLTFKRFQPEELAPFLFPARGEKKKYFLYVEKLL